MENVKIIICGLGAMGCGIAKMLLDKKGISIIACIDNNSNKVGKDLGEVLGLQENLSIDISNNFNKTIKETKADIVILAIDSFIKNIYPYIKTIVENKMNCITIAEEMAYPYTADEDLAKDLDRLAKENGVSILGTGVNPGFVLDTLIITLSAACRRVQSICASRVNDLSPFGTTVMRSQGVGTTVEKFENGISDGSIVGHVGFRQSIPMIAKALGIEIDDIIETREPIISNTYRETPYVKVEPGMVAGCSHTGYGMKNGKAVITLEHPQQIHPGSEGVDTGDYIYIKGDPDMHLSIKPETPGGIGTIAVAVNMIPQVIASMPGLKTMVDLPLPHALENSFAEAVKYYKEGDK
ncbi:2,4-diaminopentanoate dehydrogenase [Clostridium swellfunianum]|uniref:2,4-diaminopentanoate dehydrogenase n=1 Tax=Clostridium swellfunianum TaxID=1367462 RepID=UPI00202DFFC6|nr:2,4-diaminopentanoate dehydrogenase [Clostridium swellfunianum]MCM0648785.1 2,4-diaminopentanoate dehydrogenase [Clostridium swellfunianum]